MTRTELEELSAELREMAATAPVPSVRAELLRLAEDYAARAAAGRSGVAIRRQPREWHPSHVL